MKIIAFDLGRRLGWATNLRRKHQWGCAEFSEVRAHREMEFMMLLRGELAPEREGRKLLPTLSPGTLAAVDAVVFETPFARGRAATRSMWGMAGVLEACASEAGKPVVDVSVATIKKFATGSGNAPKNSMVAAARKLGYRGRDDNEADAYCLLKYAEVNLERVRK